LDGFTGPSAVYAHIGRRSSMDEALANTLIERKRQNAKPVMLVAPGGLTDEIEAKYRSAGVPVFHDISTSFEALHCHYETLPKSSALADSPAVKADGQKLKAILQSKLQANTPGAPLSETD